MKLKQSGISIVEALIGLSIAAGVSVIIMNQQQTMSKMQSKNNANQAVISISNAIQIALADRATCTLTLQGKGITDPVPQIKEGKADPTDYTNIIPTGKIIADTTAILPGDIKIDSMKIIEIDEGGGNKFDNLQVIFNSDPRAAKKMLGASVNAKNFRIQGLKDGTGKYVDCYSETSNLIGTALEMACSSLNGNWDGTKCIQSTKPIYLDTTNGALTTTPHTMFQNSSYSCSNCGSGCNPCPSGWSETVSNCSMGGQCGFRKWRNCTSTCSRSIGQTPLYGEVILGLPK